MSVHACECMCEGVCGLVTGLSRGKSYRQAEFSVSAQPRVLPSLVGTPAVRKGCSDSLQVWEPWPAGASVSAPEPSVWP